MTRQKLIVALFVGVVTSACGSVAPDAGNEAVLISKPLFFGHGGIHAEPIKTGRSFVAATTDAVYVNMQPMRIDVNFDDLMTADGVPIDFHAVVSLTITDSVKMVREFGSDNGVVNENGTAAVPGFWVRNLDQDFRSSVRDSVKRRGMNEIAIVATAADEVDREISERLTQIILATGVPVKLNGVSLGRANPPDAIKNQRVATAEQEQRVNTEKQRKLAEDMRKAAEESRASADQAYIQKMGLNPSQYVSLEQIRMQRDVCAGGKCTFILGGGDVVPTLSVR